MPLSRVMKAEEFTKATEDELRQKANECFDKLSTHGSTEKPALLIEAQFYIDEIERRKQDKIAARDYRLEKVVIFLEVIVIILIGLELLDGNKQLTVLDSLNTSADATARAMKSVQKAQEDALGTQKETLHTIGQMNAAMQNQLELLSAEQRRQREAAARKPTARRTLAGLISEGVAIRDRAGQPETPDLLLIGRDGERKWKVSWLRISILPTFKHSSLGICRASHCIPGLEMRSARWKTSLSR
jgi:hypothetical protein